MTRVLLLVALGLAAPAFARMPGMAMSAAKPACAKPEVAPGFEGWGRGAPAPQLKLGGFSSLALAPAGAVDFSPPLGRAAKPGDMGGIYALTLTRRGVYRFALGGGAWIDVIGSKGQRMVSGAHTPGPACSGIAKIVDFALEPGDYVVQLSGAQAKALPAMVVAR